MWEVGGRGWGGCGGGGGGCVFFFFFKQKTAYEIGTGDWSSDVCSSDLSVHALCTSGSFLAASLIAFIELHLQHDQI